MAAGQASVAGGGPVAASDLLRAPAEHVAALALVANEPRAL
jgi:hypothetical protein